MAEYKVAQDVEAEDKLIGPFSFRQFIYLIIVAIAIALAWGLSRIFIGLAIIPLPVILFFGAMALPLRKDQPMEVYLTAVVSFYLKPRKRVWSPDGIDSLIEITAPKVVEKQLTKDLTENEAERRLSYLADIADTGGWAIRHVAQPVSANSSMQTDQYYEAQQTDDVLGDDGGVAHNFDTIISNADAARRQRVVTQMQQVAHSPTQSATIPADTQTQQTQLQNVNVQTQPNDQNSPHYNPYPTIHQSVVRPIDEQQATHQASANQPTTTTTSTNPSQTTPTPSNPPQSEPSTSTKPVSDDIISLANNSDLSIETIQREASRIQHKEEEGDGEVFISLH